MKGVVFKELINMAEKHYGEEVIERVIDVSNLESGGAYSSVGTYDHSEILTLVTNLCQETGTDGKELVIGFGKHLMHVFRTVHPNFFDVKDAFTFLKSVHDIIHVEVKKLYPQAQLPTITCTDIIPGQSMCLTYKSARPFADLAHGLILGAIEHFEENIEIEMLDKSANGSTLCDFILTKKN